MPDQRCQRAYAPSQRRMLLINRFRTTTHSRPLPIPNPVAGSKSSQSSSTSRHSPHPNQPCARHAHQRLTQRRACKCRGCTAQSPSRPWRQFPLGRLTVQRWPRGGTDGYRWGADLSREEGGIPLAHLPWSSAEWPSLQMRSGSCRCSCTCPF